MNQAQDVPPRPANYKPGTGSDRYARFAEDWLDVTRTYVFDTLCQALEEHQQVIAIGGNGLGKSYFVGAAGIPALYTNPHTIVHVTAGTSTTLKNNIWKPTRGLFKDAKRRYGLPGRYLDGSREIRTEIADKWYFECVSPAYPDDLEGPHNDNVIYFIEEADKPGVTEEHIDSVRSTVTDKDDRVCVVANPPTDEGNVVYELLESDEWHTVVFPSWESQPVRIERGLEDGEPIGGLATTWKIKQDWEEYHDEPWPGLEQAIKWSDPWYGTDEYGAIAPKNPPNPEFRDDLHERWFKRRAGIVPPQNSSVWRPWSVATVDETTSEPLRPSTTSEPIAIGVDVARKGGDSTVVCRLFEDRALFDEWSHTDHNENGARIRKILEQYDPVPPNPVDAVGEGSAVADRLQSRYRSTIRFKAGSKPIQEDEYYDSWSEALDRLGSRLPDLTIDNADAREELFAAARVVEFEEKRRRSGDVIKATPKSEIKDHLGESPDHLDALAMAAWAAPYYDHLADSQSASDSARRSGLL